VVAVKLGPREVSRAESADGELQITKRIDDDPSWLNGPPYAVEEVVFDEGELVGSSVARPNCWVRASRTERAVSTIFGRAK
jgi:hypothetical protein